jgi:hypothetical protein
VELELNGFTDWSTHVTASDEIMAWLAARNITLRVYPWGDEAAAAGLDRDALYLMRGDSYVALADSTARAGTLESDGAARGIAPGLAALQAASG